MANRVQVNLIPFIQAKEREIGLRLTRRFIAEKAGVHEANIGPYINGTISRPSLSALGNLADYFGCRPGDLLRRVTDNEN